MVELFFTEIFDKKRLKIKDESMKQKIKKIIFKIKQNPEIGKPMRYSRKSTREVYIKPFRLSYQIKEDNVYFLDLYHKDFQ